MAREKGYSLIELIIVVAAMSILTYIGSSFLQSMIKGHLKSQIDSTLLTMKSQLLNCATSPTGVFGTVLDPVNSTGAASFECLFTKGACFPYSAASALPMPIKLNSSALATGPGASTYTYFTCGGYDTLTPTSGFNSLGSLCNTFSLTAPDPMCPFRYDVRWKPGCADANCKNVTVQFLGQLLVSGSSEVINTGALNFLTSFNYSTVPVEEFGVAETAPADASGGKCTNRKWVPRTFNTVLYDSDVFLTSVAPLTVVPGTVFFISAAGTEVFPLSGHYICHATAPAFQVKKHRARLLVVDSSGTRTFLGNNAISSADKGFLQTTSEVFAEFDIATGGYLRLEHWCEESIGGFDFGRGYTSPEEAPPADSENIFNTLECSRIQ